MCKMNTKSINDNYRRVCENLDWSISDVDADRIELGKHSPAGEDFSFVADIENFVQSVKEYAAAFEPDEHIEMWIEARKSGTPLVPPIRELVHDAEAIDEMLQELASALAVSGIFPTKRKDTVKLNM